MIIKMKKACRGVRSRERRGEGFARDLRAPVHRKRKEGGDEGIMGALAVDYRQLAWLN